MKNLNINLNKQQKEAVNYKNGPVMVIAGAGTGKTTVLTERVKRILAEKKASPSEILALTFTEKAAREMEERIDVALPMGYIDTWVCTFHSFAEKVLRDEAIHIGLDPEFQVITQAEAQLFLQTRLDDFPLKYFRPLGNPTKFIGGLITHFNRLKDEDISPKEYSKWAKNIKGTSEKAKYMELAAGYELYEKLKIEKSVMDFSDLIYHTLQLFRKRTDVLDRYQKKFKHILVDEFQDTNYTQTELIVLLASKHKNIAVFLDDDQSIYRFRGAAVYNAMDFRKHFPKTHVIVLINNYRSSQNILDTAYKLIQKNNPERLEIREEINKRLIAKTLPQGEDPKIIWMQRGEDEAEQVVKEIERLVESKQFDYKDVAILVRANNHADIFVRSLKYNNVPYQFLGVGQLYNRPEIKDIIAFLHVLADFTNDQAMYRILSKQHFGLDRRDLAGLVSWSKKQNMSLFEGAEKLVEIHDEKGDLPVGINSSTARKVTKLVRIIRSQQNMVPNTTPGGLVYNFLKDTGLLGLYRDVKSIQQQREITNISKFFDQLKSFEYKNPDATVYDWLVYFEHVWSLGESPLVAEADWTEANAVNILTVHSAKGLEFPIVFMVNLVNDRFPVRARREQIPISDELIKEELPKGSIHEQEERRLFYVGMTRAKRKLYFSGAQFYGENKRPKKLSGFVFEALGEYEVSLGVSNKERTLFDWFSEESVVHEDPYLNQKVTYLSYSQIDTFRICPLHYKLRYVLNIPTPPNAALSFGQSMHATMKRFYQEYTKDKNAKSTLLNMLNKTWISQGYKSKKHEADMKKNGEESLRRYLDKQFDEKNEPVALELPFTIHIGDIRVGGRIDRIDMLADGVMEVIDYKTGAIRTKSQLQKDLQLAIYALAVTDKNIFGHSLDKLKLSLYFFEEGEKITVTLTEQNLQKAKEKIEEIRNQIEKSDFTCSNHILCKQGCEFNLFCNR